MMSPKRMCRPPKPAPRMMFDAPSGRNPAATPRSMKATPMTGITRIEKAPLLTKAVPYNSSHVGRNRRIALRADERQSQHGPRHQRREIADEEPPRRPRHEY